MFDISLGDFDLNSRSILYEKSKTSMFIFSLISQSIWKQLRMLPPPCDMLKLMLPLLSMMNTHGRLYEIVNTGMC